VVLCDCISNKCRSEEEVTVKDGSYYDKKSAKCLPYAGLSQLAVRYCTGRRHSSPFAWCRFLSPFLFCCAESRVRFWIRST
jgi:hypothetical protein